MQVRWRRILPIIGIASVGVISFSIYVDTRPEVYCMIVNESAQTTIKASGERCTTLSPDEEAVVFTREGTSYSAGSE